MQYSHNAAGFTFATEYWIGEGGIGDCHLFCLIFTSEYLSPIFGNGSVTFQIIGDNLDVYQKPRHMMADHKSRDYHWFHIRICSEESRQCR